MLKSIRITNFKCFKDHEFNFNGLTYLTGGNAVGKSSLLQALVLLSQIEKDGPTMSLLPKWNNESLGTPEKILSNNSDSNQIQFSLRFDDGKSRKCIFDISDAVENQYKFMITADDEHYFLNDYKINYISAERISPRTRHQIGFKNNYVGKNGEFAVEAISVFEYKRNINGGDIYTFLDDKKKLSFRQACEYCLERIFGNTELQISNGDREASKTLLIKNGGDFYEPIATGFGISYCLPIVVQGLIALFDRTPILIIENPEAHLHPKSQSELGKFLAALAKNGVQIIVETHSEHIITGSCLVLGNDRDYNMLNTIFFERENNAFTQKNLIINQFGEIEEWPDGFFDQTEKDLREIMIRKAQNG